MSKPSEDRRREYPGDRFSRRVIEQNLDELTEKLEQEEFGEKHLEQGHNQIELFREGKTTVSLFVLEEGAELPEHSVDDGSVMIHVLKGGIELETDETEDALSPVGENTVVTLGAGVKHTLRARESSRLLVTIMRS